MCWRHRGNSQGDQYSWSTSGEGDSGRKVGWRWPTAWPYGSCRSFQKLQSLLRGQWQVRKRLTRNKCHHLTWFLKDHSESPVKVKPKGVKETVRRLFKRPVGKGIYRPLKQKRRAALTLWITQKQNVSLVSFLLAPVLLSFLLAQVCFSTFTSNSRICGQKGKISSCQSQGEIPAEGPGWITGPSWDRPVTHCVHLCVYGPGDGVL